MLDEIVKLGLPAIILDRNPIIADDRDRLTVQRVPEHIGGASYPARLLSRPRLLGHFEERYELRAEFESNDRPSGPAVFRGYYFVRRGA